MAKMSQTEHWVEQVRRACEQAALEAFEQASISGLCCEGAWEAALGALRSLDPQALAAALKRPDSVGHP